MIKNNLYQSLQQIITVQEIASRLHESGICSPIVNAEIMLSYLLGLRAIDLYTDKLTLSLPDSEMLENMITRRVNGEPLQYITGKTNFYGHDIIVKKGVFIPRPETEILVEAVINIIKDSECLVPNTETHILDLCTGSGNIAISLTKALTHCKIISSDISAIALETVQENAKLAGVFKRVMCIKANLLSLPREHQRAFDMIVCNPPYIRYSDTGGLSTEVMQEPSRALYGGIDGMDFYRRIVKDSPVFLKSNAFIALEIPDNSKLEVEKIIYDSGSFSEIIFFNDLNGIERVVTARLKNG